MKLPEIISNEKKFAKAYRDRYIMGNNRNKEFVKIPLLDIKELEEYYNVDLILQELTLLGFSNYVTIKDDQYIVPIRDNETREIKAGRIFTVYQFDFYNYIN